MKKILIGFIAIAFVAALFGFTAVNADAADYIGVKKCKACHIKQFKSWKKIYFFYLFFMSILFCWVSNK